MLGFTLEEIKRIFRLRNEGKAACGCVISMAEVTLAETERKLRETRRFAASLRKHLAHWRAMPQRAPADFCKLIETS